jgi:hypothetical protein
VVPKLCSADPLGSATISHGFRGYIPIMAPMKFAYLFNYSNNVLLKIIEEHIYFAMCLFRVTVTICNREKFCNQEASDIHCN